METIEVYFWAIKDTFMLDTTSSSSSPPCIKHQAEETMIGKATGIRPWCCIFLVFHQYYSQGLALSSIQDKSHRFQRMEEDPTLKPLRYVEFYSGLGGWTMALAQARDMLSLQQDLECVASFDHSDLCQDVYFLFFVGSIKSLSSVT